MYYYQRLRDIREDMDLKQEELANKLNMTRQQYQLYESGKREIPFHSVIELAGIFGISIDYIAGRTNDKKGLTRSELSQEEKELIKKYRTLSVRRQGRLAERLDMLEHEERQEKAKRKEAI